MATSEDEPSPLDSTSNMSYRPIFIAVMVIALFLLSFIVIFLFNTTSNPVVMAYSDYLKNEFSNLEYYVQASEEQITDFYKKERTVSTITNYDSCLQLATFIALYSDEHEYACVKAGGLYEQAANVADRNKDRLSCYSNAKELYRKMQTLYNNKSAAESIKNMDDLIWRINNGN